MRVITIGAGHRGTGKSFLTAHLGLALAREGVRTHVADFDFRAADLHLMLGLFDARGETVRDYLDGARCTLSEIARPVPDVDDLRIVPGSDETIRAACLGPETVARLRADLSSLPGDVVLVDLEAGCDNALIDLFLLGDDQWVVARRETGSLQQAAAFLRRARLRTATRGCAAPPPARPRVYTSLDDLVRDMSALKGESEGFDGAAGRRALLLNRCRSDGCEDSPDAWLDGVLDAGDAAGGLPVIAEVPEDPRVPSALDGVPSLAAVPPEGPAAAAIRRLAESIAADVKSSPAEPALEASPQSLPV
jgi:MinD-like ATPase involved in chromosome partitioning or flagellar assembly